MSAKTKIVVLHMKKIILTVILVLSADLRIALLFRLFSSPGEKDSPEPDESTATMQYHAGVYTSTVLLNNSSFEVQVAVDEEHINSITLVNVDESIETMYPLVRPTLDELSSQILANQSVENVSYRENNQYTSVILYNAIVNALQKAISD